MNRFCEKLYRLAMLFIVAICGVQTAPDRFQLIAVLVAWAVGFFSIVVGYAEPKKVGESVTLGWPVTKI